MKDPNQDIIEDLSWMTEPPPPPPVNYWPYIWTAVGIVVLVVMALFLRQYLRARRNRLPRIARPHLKALKALKALEKLLKDGNDRRFVQEVSDIARTYIQDRFGLRAPHRSTEEFLLEASRSDQLSANDQAMLGDFLRQCDQVKFALQSAGVGQMKQLLESARNFVAQTAPGKSLAIRHEHARRVLQEH